MIFKHPIFRKGNEDNFRKIIRKKRSRDDALSLLDNDYSDVLELIRNSDQIGPELKELL